MSTVAALITAVTTVAVAGLAYLLNQRGQIAQERRQARLRRVSRQIRELYGPLHVMVDINEQIWEKLRESHLPASARRRPDLATDSWRRWRDHALMPVNRAMRDLIVEHADLVPEYEVPEPLLNFCSHVAAVEVQLAAESDSVYVHPLVPHPGAAYVQYVRDTFGRLKAEQQKLGWTLDQ
ncbi:hypothetical protein ABZV58_19080 [Nocardia sp. NPDC004654]|uniref:hypothetical protein n=1 Tax=Nocardia sp. NPDC004654 TaxID=3154776 RepID=UPI0033B6BF8D